MVAWKIVDGPVILALIKDARVGSRRRSALFISTLIWSFSVAAVVRDERVEALALREDPGRGVGCIRQEWPTWCMFGFGRKGAHTASLASKWIDRMLAGDESAMRMHG